MTRLFAWLFSASVAATAVAQTAPLVDPTRPPGAGAEAEAGSGLAPVRLQSVLISPTRRVAVISGKNVALGAKFGDATVESINESAVVLKYADRRETLQLIPGMDKRERRVAAAARSGPAAWEKGNPR